jgi:hypothetical protein
MASVETTPARRPPYDEDGFGLIVGSGVFLVQVFAIIPGLLPCLLLLLPLVLPVVVLGLAAGLLVGVPLGIWRLVTSARRRVGSRRPERGDSGGVTAGTPALSSR